MSTHSNSVCRLLCIPVLIVAANFTSRAQVSSANLTPSSGTFSYGQQITFSMSAYSGDNWLNVNDYMILEISTVTSHPWSSACQVQYQPYTYTAFLTSDNGGSFSQTAVGSNSVLANSQCYVNFSASSASITGSSTSPTINLPITFSSSFTGTLYLSVGVCQCTSSSQVVWHDIGSISVTSGTQVSAPTFSPGGGNFGSSPSVSIYTATNSATIRYTTDGTTPTETWGNIYSSPVNMSGFTTFKALAYRSGWTDSSVTTAVYDTIQGLPDTLSVTASSASGTYAANNTVTTSGSVTVPSGAGATFLAGGTITLGPGFHATAGSQFHAAIAQPDFILGAAPASGYNGTVNAGSATAYSITATGMFGFSAPVQLSTAAVSGLPAGASVSFGSGTITPPTNRSASTTMIVSTNGQRLPEAGTFAPVVPASSGSLVRSADFSLTVQTSANYYFYISVNPSSITVTQGATATYTVSITPQNGFTGTVTLSLSGGPQGLSYAFNPPTVTLNNGVGSSALTINTTGLPASTYNLNVSGTGNSVTENTAISLVVNVPIQQTVSTSPAGLAFTVDGVQYTSAQTFSWSSGSIHNISTSSPQAGASGTQYVFANWSDGGGISHQITAGSASSYTANFTTQYYLTTVATPAGDGTITPGSGWYNSGTVVSISATANSGYQFTGFSGALSGTATPQNLTMSGPKSVTANFATPGSQTVTTNPSSLTITVDGTQYTAPQTFSWVSGSQHTIATSTPQAGATGTQYVFANWSDSGAISHQITAGSFSTYTANFTTQYYLTTAANPASEGSISPASGWYNSGTVVAVSATANSGYQFTGFSGGTLSGTTSPQNATMTGPVSVTANFAAQGSIYTISGRVTSGASGISGVTVSLSGSQSGSATTDSNGNYSFTVPATGNYAVTPTLSGYTFCPGSISFASLSANQTANFANAATGIPSREYIYLGPRVVATAGCGMP